MTKVTEKMVEVWAKMILEEGKTYRDIVSLTDDEFGVSLIYYHVSKYKKDGED